MAKNNKKIIIWIAVIGLFATLGTLAAGGFVGWGKIQEQQVSQDTSIKNVKDEGCLPARDNKAEIKVVTNKLRNIEEDIDEFSLEQKEMREEFAQGQKETQEKQKENTEKILKAVEATQGSNKKKKFLFFFD